MFLDSNGLSHFFLAAKIWIHWLHVKKPHRALFGKKEPVVGGYITFPQLAVVTTDSTALAMRSVSSGTSMAAVLATVIASEGRALTAIRIYLGTVLAGMIEITDRRTASHFAPS